MYYSVQLLLVSWPSKLTPSQLTAFIRHWMPVLHQDASNGEATSVGVHPYLHQPLQALAPRLSSFAGPFSFTCTGIRLICSLPRTHITISAGRQG